MHIHFVKQRPTMWHCGPTNKMFFTNANGMDLAKVQAQLHMHAWTRIWPIQLIRTKSFEVELFQFIPPDRCLAVWRLRSSCWVWTLPQILLNSSFVTQLQPLRTLFVGLWSPRFQRLRLSTWNFFRILPHFQMSSLHTELAFVRWYPEKNHAILSTRTSAHAKRDAHSAQLITSLTLRTEIQWSAE